MLYYVPFKYVDPKNKYNINRQKSLLFIKGEVSHIGLVDSLSVSFHQGRFSECSSW